MIPSGLPSRPHAPRPQCAANWNRNLKPKLAIMRQCTSVTDSPTDRRTLTSKHKCEMYILHLALKIGEEKSGVDVMQACECIKQYVTEVYAETVSVLLPKYAYVAGRCCYAPLTVSFVWIGEISISRRLNASRAGCIFSWYFWTIADIAIYI